MEEASKEFSKFPWKFFGTRFNSWWSTPREHCTRTQHDDQLGWKDTVAEKLIYKQTLSLLLIKPLATKLQTNQQTN